MSHLIHIQYSKHPVCASVSPIHFSLQPSVLSVIDVLNLAHGLSVDTALSMNLIFLAVLYLCLTSCTSLFPPLSPGDGPWAPVDR